MYAYVDDGRIFALNENDMSGNTGWEEIETGLTVNDPLTDNHGAALYKVVNGASVERTQEEREADWPEPEPRVPTIPERVTTLEETNEMMQSTIDYLAMMTDVDIPTLEEEE